jgi:predicted SprT family Zn-dependent metalloprotease
MTRHRDDHRPVRTYASLDAAYEFFNRHLFGGELPPCLITMQRHKGAYGYFHAQRCGRMDDARQVVDEIALNPAHFGERTPEAILSTLVHEMVHLWQHHFGSPSRTGYHNREWAAKMREVGLVPSATGGPGGKETGQKVSHYVEPGGPFARAFARLDAPAVLYQDLDGDDDARRRKAASKTKYTCAGCGLNAWAKPGVNLVCGDCGEAMEAEE